MPRTRDTIPAWRLRKPWVCPACGAHVDVAGHKCRECGARVCKRCFDADVQACPTHVTIRRMVLEALETRGGQ